MGLEFYVFDLSLALGKHVSGGCMSENKVYYSLYCCICFLLSVENMNVFQWYGSLIHKIYFPVWLWMFGCLKPFGVQLNCLRSPYSPEKNGKCRILVLRLLKRELLDTDMTPVHFPVSNDSTWRNWGIVFSRKFHFKIVTKIAMTILTSNHSDRF